MSVLNYITGAPEPSGLLAIPDGEQLVAAVNDLTARRPVRLLVGMLERQAQNL